MHHAVPSFIEQLSSSIHVAITSGHMMRCTVAKHTPFYSGFLMVHCKYLTVINSCCLMCTAYKYIMHSIFLTTSHTHALDGACCGMCKMGDNLIRIESFFPYHPTDELLTWLSGYNNVKLDTGTPITAPV